MRTIRFRALALSDNKFVYGSLLQLKDKTMIYDDSEVGHDVDPETVGQFTRLVDKNGVEIYEGDILNYAEPRNSYHTKNQRIEVVFGERERYPGGTIPYNGFVGFSFINHSKGFSTVFDESDIEVIGNIHQHPHLLEEK